MDINVWFWHQSKLKVNQFVRKISFKIKNEIEG